MEKVYSSQWLSGRALKLSSGRVVANPHRDTDCSGRHCPIHNPSDHEYRDYPLDFNGVHMVRIDPTVEGGVRIDPDDYVYQSTGSAILENSAYCHKCKEDVVSESRHEAARCSCGNILVDGGHSYFKRGVKWPEFFEDTSIVATKPEV